VKDETDAADKLTNHHLSFARGSRKTLTEGKGKTQKNITILQPVYMADFHYVKPGFKKKEVTRFERSWIDGGSIEVQVLSTRSTRGQHGLPDTI